MQRASHAPTPGQHLQSRYTFVRGYRMRPPAWRGHMLLRDFPDWSTRMMYEALYLPSPTLLADCAGRIFRIGIAVPPRRPRAVQPVRQVHDSESIQLRGQTQPDW